LYQNQYPGIDARLVSIVRIKSKHLLGRFGIRAEDLEDFRQEWIAKAIHSEEYENRNDPQFTTYIGRVVDRLIIQEVRRRKAEKRDYRALVYSMDDYLEANGEESTWHDVVSERDYIEATGNRFTEHRDAVERRQDIEAFIHNLPADLQELALQLKSHPMEHIPEVSGISRATAFRRLQKLREAASRFFSEDF